MELVKYETQSCTSLKHKTVHRGHVGNPATTPVHAFSPEKNFTVSLIFCTFIFTVVLPYMSKFLRHVIFADPSNPRKLSPQNFRIPYVLETLDPQKMLQRNVWK